LKGKTTLLSERVIIHLATPSVGNNPAEGVFQLRSMCFPLAENTYIFTYVCNMIAHPFKEFGDQQEAVCLPYV
jgi:hypothetical protein